MPAKQPPFYPGQKRLLVALGERLRLARLRRKLTIEVTCQRAGISRMTLFRAEAGSAAIALGTVLRILAVLGLESDLDALARDDKAGRLQVQALPVRRRRSSARAGTESQGARTMTDQVEVWLDADFLERTRVGTLTHDRGTLRFVYEPEWLKNSCLGFSLRR